MNEIKILNNLVNKVHKSIKYGNGDQDALFTDEVLKVGEGHCGHYSRMLFTELLKLHYSPEIISIKTFDGRHHAMIQVKTKNNNVVLLDATTNIIYKNDAGEIIHNPYIINKSIIGKSVFPAFSNISFWSNIQSLKFLPYLDANVIKDYKINNKDLNTAFDFLSSTIYDNNEKYFEVEFKHPHRLSSIVIYSKTPKDPIELEITCYNNTLDKSIFKKSLINQRSLFPINFYEKVVCKKLSFQFSDILKIQDIYIYGK